MRPITFVRPLPLRPSGGTLYDERVLREWRGTRVPHRDVPVPGSWPEPDAADRQRLARELRDAPGPVLVDGLVGGSVPDELADAEAAGIPLFLLIHLPQEAEWGLDDRARAATHVREAAALRHVRGVIVPSHFAADDLRRRFGDACPVTVAIPGTDNALPALGSDPLRLTCLGVFSRSKNHALLVDALAPLAGRPWTLSLAGPEPERGSTLAAIRESVARSGIAGQVRFEGLLTGEPLEVLWSRTDLLLLPSLVEMFGMVVTEALAHGVPALVSAETGAVEALGGSGASQPGAALDPTDPGAWTAAITGWLDDPQLRATWSAAAHQRRHELTGWRHTARVIADALAET